MRKAQAQPPPDPEDEGALQTILDGTAAGTGDGFFKAMAQNLARALKAHGAWITEYLPAQGELRPLAYFIGGEWVDDHEFKLQGTPCGAVIEDSAFIHFPDRLAETYPNDPHIKGGIVSYMGAPLLGTKGEILGHMAVVDKRPMPKVPRILAIFRIFAARAAAEVRRLQAQREADEQKQKCRRLFECAMDAIVDLDAQLKARRANPAAARLLGAASPDTLGHDLARYFSDPGRETLKRMMRDLDSLPGERGNLSVSGGVEARRSDGHAFAAEATLFHGDDPAGGYTLFLRDSGERVEQERRTRGLSAEMDRLKDLVRSMQRCDDIIGRSEPMQAAMRQVQRSAETDGPVLILGEAGTGKALLARAIHARGRRRDRAFIGVNCAELPAGQVETELFGQERGPAGGAERREGAVLLAEGGTLYLQEIAGLAAPLQARILRLITDQEMELAGRARKVDVRVVVGTSHDLERAVAEGRFRRDLCDRLNAFTITLPPLRQRGGDIPLLAASFAQRCAARIGRTIQPLTAEQVERLAAEPWPGNVHELRGVIDRAVLGATDGRLDLDRALPRAPEPVAAAPVEEPGPPKVLTVADLMKIEYDNILRALEVSGGDVTGAHGVAALLGVKPAMIMARMKALGIAFNEPDPPVAPPPAAAPPPAPPAAPAPARRSASAAKPRRPAPRAR